MRISGAILPILFAALLAGPVAANEQFFNPLALVKDKTMRWRTDAGPSSVTYIGRSGRAFMFTQSSPPRNGRDRVETLCWVDASGQVYKARVGTETMRFVPNDCALTPGRCTYELVLRDGTRIPYIRHSRVTGNRWAYRLYRETEDAEGIVERGAFLLDEAGFFIRRDWTAFTADGPQQRWSRRIQ